MLSDSEAARRMFDAARRARPDLLVSLERFRDWLVTRVPEPGALGEERAGDLLLAIGCVDGDPLALEAFEKELMPAAEVALSRLRLAPQEVDELKQVLRHRLLLEDEEGHPPRMEQYSGRGELRRWVQACATRVALSFLREKRPEIAGDEELLLAVPIDATLPEAAQQRAELRREISGALREAVAGLSVKERLLLRQYFLDGLTFQEIASFQGVHLTTVYRWVEKARQSLAGRARELLATRLKLSPSELQTANRLLESHLDITFGGLFGSTTPGS